MKSKTEIFDDMLNLTTELFFDMENLLFYENFGQDDSSLLEIGCGNGAYLSRLHHRFPRMLLTGIDIDKEVFRIAEAKQTDRLKFVHAGYENFNCQDNYDYILARLVVGHLANRRHFMDWLNMRTRQGSIIFILDTDDERFCGDGRLPLFHALYKDARRQSVRRSLLSLRDSLKLEFLQAGFTHVSTQSYAIRSDGPLVKQQLYTYMQLVSEYFLGSPIPADLHAELIAWRQDELAALEIPMFGTVFLKPYTG